MLQEGSNDICHGNLEENVPEEIEQTDENQLEKKIDQLLVGFQKSDISTYVALYKRPFKMFLMNVWMGIGRGIGYLMGFAIGGLIMVYILNQIVEINLPVIGDFIAQLVTIVQNQLGEGQ